MRFLILLACILILSACTRPMTHAEAIADGWIDGSDGYWAARTGAPLDLTPISTRSTP